MACSASPQAGNDDKGEHHPCCQDAEKNPAAAFRPGHLDGSLPSLLQIFLISHGFNLLSLV
jgi:hypothetical protein